MSSDLNLCINDVFIYNENNDVITDNINCMHDYYPTSRYVYSNEKTYNTTCLSIIHFNARSLIKNFDNIKHYLLSTNNVYDVIVVTETWLKAYNKDLYLLDGYNVSHTISHNKRGGGISIYSRDIFNYDIINRYTSSIDSICDILTIKLSHLSPNSKEFIITGIYKSPNYNILIFNEFLHSFLDYISNYKDTFICGDFNIDIINKNKSPIIYDFINIFYQFSFYPTINKPTRIQGNCLSLIDNIFTNTNKDYDNNYIHVIDTSDHFPISISILNMFSKVTHPVNNCNSYRYIKNNNIIKLTDYLKFTDWDFIYKINESELACSTFLSYLTEIFHKFSFVKKIKFDNKNKFPWIDKSIKKELLKKNKLYNTFISDSSLNNKNRYKNQRNKCTKLIRDSEIAYNSKMLNLNSNKWKHLNKLLTDGSSKVNHSPFDTTSHETANRFNDYFSEIGL